MTTDTQVTGNTQTTGDAQPAAPAAAPAATPTLSVEATTSKAAEGQPAGEATPAAAGTTDTPAAEAAKPAVPEKYEFKAPDGVELDADAVAEFSTVARELGLSQDAAQKVVEKMAVKLHERQTAQLAANLERFKETQAAAVKADKQLGGDRLNENLAVAEKALATFGTPALRELLQKTGLSHNVEVIRAFYAAGKAIDTDRHVAGGVRPTKGEANAARGLYPTMPS